METAKIVYEGNLRTICTHVKSNTQIMTDAPPDNKGKGEKFSPTDLLTTALGACIVTIMGIKANKRNINISNTKLQVTKIMSSKLPRKVVEIKININFPEKNYSKKEKAILENVASVCPVALSIHPDIKQNIQFNWAS